jgi:hypothetical protein
MAWGIYNVLYENLSLRATNSMVLFVTNYSQFIISKSMALENLISVEFTQDELNKLDDALKVIETILVGKAINLTPEQRSQYGRIGNRTENWIDKIKQYMDDNPKLVPAYLDKAEYDKDYKTRKDIAPRLNRLTSICESMDDTQKLISTDLYGNSIAFYRNLKITAQQNVAGSSAIYADLKTQFPGNPGSKAGGNNPPTP